MALLVAGTAIAQQPQRIEKIEVTGSNIKRVDTETVTPLQIITREDIERSGQPTVAEVLRNLPANTGGSFSESFTNSFAPGAAGISLRGLGQKATLVLLNGRRVTGYGFAQNLQDTFFNLFGTFDYYKRDLLLLSDTRFGRTRDYRSEAVAATRSRSPAGAHGAN